MTKAAEALYAWFTQFDLPVYLADDVPDEAELPYITVSLQEPEWNMKATLAVQVWYYTKSNVQVMSKADEIVGSIGQGLRIPFDGGMVILWPETPLAQLIVEDNVRRAYINLSINSYHLPGE